MPGSARPRLQWMDAVRGTAMLLLILWHSTAVPELLGQPMPPALRDFNDFFMPFRMPTLMLLSGMLLARSLHKPLPTYLAGKFANIAWPYVVWILIAKAIFLDIQGIPWWHWRAWYATSYLWFLFFIGCYYLIAPLIRRLPLWLPVATAWTLSVVLPQGGVEQRLAYFAILDFLGHALNTSSGLGWLLRGRRPWLWIVAALAFGAASIRWSEQLQYAGVFAPLSLAGCLALVWLYRNWTADNPLTGAVEFVGRSSLVYYVAHFPIMVLVSRPLLTSWGPWALAALNLVAALVVCTGLAVAQHRRPWTWLFRSPTWLTSLVSRGLGKVGLRR